MALELTSSFEVIDPRFRKLALPYIHVEKLYTGCRWAEGPAWFAAGRYLVWSDIPERPHAALGRDRWLGLGVPPAVDEQQRPHRRPAGPPGLVRAPQPLRVAHRVRRHAHRAGRPLRRQALQLAQRRGGQERRQHLVHRPELRHRLGLRRRRGAERDRRLQRLPHRPGERPRHRRRPRTSCSPTGSRSRPTNRCCTSPTPASRTRRTGRTTCGASRCRPTAASISGGEVFATCPVGVYDGFRVDVHGNLWLSAGDGVHCHASDGTLLGKILIPEAVANVCFGGPKLNRLFICGTTSLYSVFLNTRAAPRGLISER